MVGKTAAMEVMVALCLDENITIGETKEADCTVPTWQVAFCQALTNQLRFINLNKIHIYYLHDYYLKY